MRLAAVVVLALPLPLPLPAQVTIYSDLGGHGDRVAQRLLEARLSEPPRLQAWPRNGLIPTGATGLLLGVDVHTLHALSSRLVPTIVDELEPPFRDAAGTYAVTLLSPFVVAFNAELLDPADLPGSWDDLLDLKYQDRLAVGTPSAMPDLWDMWWARELRRGDGERRAIAWLTTLDARITSYAGSGQQVTQALVAGNAALGVVARHRLEQAPLGQILLAGEVAAAGLGVARLSAPDDPRADAVHAVLVSESFNRDLAAELGLVAVPRADEDLVGRSLEDRAVLGRLQPRLLDRAARDSWVKVWEEEIRGRGRGLEDLSEFLDLILGLAVIGFLVFVYTRIRRSEPRRARTSTND